LSGRAPLRAARERRRPASQRGSPIADTSPDSPYSDLAVGQAINDLGQVALVAALKAGGQATRYRFKVMRVLRREPDGNWKVHRTMWNDAPLGK